MALTEKDFLAGSKTQKRFVFLLLWSQGSVSNAFVRSELAEGQKTNTGTFGCFGEKIKTDASLLKSTQFKT